MERINPLWEHLSGEREKIRQLKVKAATLSRTVKDFHILTSSAGEVLSEQGYSREQSPNSNCVEFKTIKGKRYSGIFSTERLLNLYKCRQPLRGEGTLQYITCKFPVTGERKLAFTLTSVLEDSTIQYLQFALKEEDGLCFFMTAKDEPQFISLFTQELLTEVEISPVLESVTTLFSAITPGLHDIFQDDFVATDILPQGQSKSQFIRRPVFVRDVVSPKRDRRGRVIPNQEVTQRVNKTYISDKLRPTVTNFVTGEVFPTTDVLYKSTTKFADDIRTRPLDNL